MQTIRLDVSGLGHIPAIKNSFHAIVAPKNRLWKRRCVGSFVSQLLSGTATGASGTPTPVSPRCLIALLPQDDSWRDLPQITIRCAQVPPGQEGATLFIEEI